MGRYISVIILSLFVPAMAVWDSITGIEYYKNTVVNYCQWIAACFVIILVTEDKPLIKWFWIVFSLLLTLMLFHFAFGTHDEYRINSFVVTAMCYTLYFYANRKRIRLDLLKFKRYIKKW